MRIGFEYTPAIYQRHGIGRYVRSLVDALVEIDADNEYVLFYSHPHNAPPRAKLPDRPNVVARAVGISERTLYRAWFRIGLPLPADLFTGRLDVFHFSNFVLPPLRSSHSVLTVHDLSFLLHPEHTEEGLRGFLERTVPPSVRRADFVLVDSANAMNEVICVLDVSPERVDVIYPGAGPEFRPIEDRDRLDAVLGKYGIERPFILNVGMIEPRKNLSRLLDAYARLRTEVEVPHRLCIAGGLGWLYDDIFRKVEELGLRADVRFLGFVPNEDLVCLYNSADLMVFPSIYEGFGIPPLEAMACGTPVVTSNSSSLPEVVGDAGLMARPTDVEGLTEAMAQIITNPGLREDLARKGLERARRFTWRAAAEKLLGIYARVADGGRA